MGTGSVTSTPNGINCGALCSATFAVGSQVILIAAPAAGSTFTGWSGACSGIRTCSVVMNGNTSVTATFNGPPKSYVLTVSVLGSGTGTVTSSPAGITCRATCQASFASETQVALTATSSSDSTFAGWGGACSGTGACSVTMSGKSSVTATFDGPPNSYTLTVEALGTGTGTVTSSPAGINCGSLCHANFASGTQVALTAVSGGNSTFAGWGGACVGTGACSVTMSGRSTVTAMFNGPSTSAGLSVAVLGTGTGIITSTPAGINCGSTCSAKFSPGTKVTLTATPSANSYLVSWDGSCSGSSVCVVTVNGSESVTGTINIWPINHIIFLAQENRSFDHYFGELRQYWAQNGYPDQSLDGLPQFNPTSGIAPLYSPPPTNPGCDPAAPYSPPPAPFQDCVFDINNPFASYHLLTQCVENPSPFWNESHIDWTYYDPTGTAPAKLDGFVFSGAHDARDNGYYDNYPYFDTNGVRVMGYYDGDDLNYYYFMASNFAISDRWFDPVLTRTNANREYLIAATSQGYVYPVGSNAQDQKLITSPTIFQELQGANISWKIYVDPATGVVGNPVCSGPPYDATCLLSQSYAKDFAWSQTITTANIGTIGPLGTCGPSGQSTCDFENDLANGTLPQVVQIEPPSSAGLDEHPTDVDISPSNIQLGANFVSQLINEVMQSQYWKDSVFVLTYDESGGFYDHVRPQPAVSPDGIPPVDLQSSDICFGITSGNCNFTYTGYRVPLIVISPYAKKNYVSHTVADTTAILKLIETRFNLPPLTARDNAQSDMSEFFDFNNPPWMTPPAPPAQNTSGACYVNKLP
ncbi:MAG: alkaline phosphatase family protein [Terriglobales bacterium]